VILTKMLYLCLCYQS